MVGANAISFENAARLAEANLSTEMIGEFPELREIMGRCSVDRQGEELSVADAIKIIQSRKGRTIASPLRRFRSRSRWPTRLTHSPRSGQSTKDQLAARTPLLFDAPHSE